MKIALTGNPNSGKTSLFNSLTGLNQKVGNYPGVTVEKKVGHTFLNTTYASVTVIDLPGTYSLYPNSLDELIAYRTIIAPKSDDRPDVMVVVVDASNLQRNLLLATQIYDLGYPMVIALTMMDIVSNQGNVVPVEQLQNLLPVPIIPIHAHRALGIGDLKNAIIKTYEQKRAFSPIWQTDEKNTEILAEIKQQYQLNSVYAALHHVAAQQLQKPPASEYNISNSNPDFSIARIQAEEIVMRYEKISNCLKLDKGQDEVASTVKNKTLQVDKLLLHPFWGYAMLLLVLISMFQVVFWVAQFPMEWIDQTFAGLQNWMSSSLPEVWWSSLLTDGMVAGIGGIVIFVPQIALLFGMIALLEDTGYMARITFLMDRLMHKLGLNGKSVMPLISGMACAIPAVMAARTIENRKERLITILITPLMSCSARLPVYVILVTLIIPEEAAVGVFSMRAIVMTGLYLLGFVTALIIARVLNWALRWKDYTTYILELPIYQTPRWKNIFITMYEKAKVFVWQAGKIIFMISIVLWFLASYGPRTRMEKIENEYAAIEAQQGVLTEDQEQDKVTAKLANSYAGILGHAIEPIIRPLGYDWKIGIALISSFAAREVFVGTMATLYSIGDAEEDQASLIQQMKAARHADGTPVYTKATGFSLLVFYAFAMQCMSTLAIVKRETGSWKWTLFQLLYLTTLAYVAAFLVYQCLK